MLRPVLEKELIFLQNGELNKKRGTDIRRSKNFKNAQLNRSTASNFVLNLELIRNLSLEYE